MTDLLRPAEVQKHKERMEQFGDFPELTFQLRLCRDYLTLWDRNKELEASIGRMMELAKQAGDMVRAGL